MCFSADTKYSLWNNIGHVKSPRCHRGAPNESRGQNAESTGKEVAQLGRNITIDSTIVVGWKKRSYNIDSFNSIAIKLER